MAFGLSLTFHTEAYCTSTECIYVISKLCHHLTIKKGRQSEKSTLMVKVKHIFLKLLTELH